MGVDPTSGLTGEEAHFGIADSAFSNDIDGPDGGMSPAGAQVKKSHRAPVIIVSIVLALLLICGGGSFGTYQYFKDRVAPGVTFGGKSVAGKTRSELETIVQQAADSTQVHITAEDKSATASLNDLGVKIDTDKTVQNLLNAKNSDGFLGFINRINPFTHESVNLTAEDINAQSLAHWARGQFITDSDQMQPANITYDKKTEKFDVVKGKTGRTVNEEALTQAVSSALASVNETTDATVELITQEQSISDETAQKAAQDANKRLGVTINLSNGDAKSFTIDKTTLASWMKFTQNEQAGSLDFSIDKDAFAQYINAHTADLNQSVIEQEDVVDSHGNVLTTRTQGRKGVEVKTDQSDAVQAVKTALDSSSSQTVTVAAQYTNFKVKKRVVRYDIPNGDRWIKVDLDAQKAYAYRGTTLERTFNISSGANIDWRKSDPGTFFVHTKYESQTMRGPGYETPGVQWISYYNGGEGFHAAPWASDNIAVGRPGSHGCINMAVGDAKWVYDFIQIGDMVRVVGSTPASPVRMVMKKAPTEHKTTVKKTKPSHRS